MEMKQNIKMFAWTFNPAELRSTPATALADVIMNPEDRLHPVDIWSYGKLLKAQRNQGNHSKTPGISTAYTRKCTHAQTHT